MPSPVVPASPPSAGTTSATPRVAGPGSPCASRTGSATSGGRPSRSTPSRGSGCTPRSASACPARTASPSRHPLPASTSSSPTARPSPRSTSPLPPATRPASCSASPAGWPSSPRDWPATSPSGRRSSSAPATAASCGRSRPMPRSSTGSTLREHHRRAARPPDRGPVHRAHDRDRRPRAALHPLDQHRGRRRPGHPVRAARLDVRRTRRARGTGLTPGLPRPDQRRPHLVVRRGARRRHRGPAGLAGRQPGVLAPGRAPWFA